MAARCLVRATWPDGTTLFKGYYDIWTERWQDAFVFASLSLAGVAAKKNPFPEATIDTPLLETFR